MTRFKENVRDEFNTKIASRKLAFLVKREEGNERRYLKIVGGILITTNIIQNIYNPFHDIIPLISVLYTRLR